MDDGKLEKEQKKEKKRNPGFWHKVLEIKK
jgi:hypothetical protein